MFKLLALLGLLLASPALAAPPFGLTWTHGVCRNCKTAAGLSEVQFVSPKEAWAIGFMPPGETGTGDYSILHSRDGGRHWTERDFGWQHNMSPEMSFSGSLTGWLEVEDIAGAQTFVLQTRDGGAHWKNVAPPDSFLRDIQYLGDGAGVVNSYNFYKKTGALWMTGDYGRHWSSHPVPSGVYPERMVFLDRDTGWFAGCRDSRLVTLRTRDGGAHWETAAIAAQVADPIRPGSCAFEIDALGFRDAQHGWLLTSKHSFGLHDDKASARIFQTSDGGAHWTQSYRTDFPMMDVELSGLVFLTDRLGLAPKWAKSAGGLLYTADGGKTWAEFAMPQPPGACRNDTEGAACPAAGFSTVRITPRP